MSLTPEKIGLRSVIQQTVALHEHVIRKPIVDLRSDLFHRLPGFLPHGFFLKDQMKGEHTLALGEGLNFGLYHTSIQAILEPPGFDMLRVDRFGIQGKLLFDQYPLQGLDGYRCFYIKDLRLGVVWNRDRCTGERGTVSQ